VSTYWRPNPGERLPQANPGPRLKTYIITNRNNTVKEQLLKLYNHKVLKGKLNVFCVSNAHYWEQRNEPKAIALPHLTLSGILSIREHCMAMVSESQLELARKYMQDDIPALLGDIELWVQSGSGSMSAERKQNIRETLDALESRLKRVKL
jgi:hypothetical protein